MVAHLNVFEKLANSNTFFKKKKWTGWIRISKQLITMKASKYIYTKSIATESYKEIKI